jgi:hypothetical protein
MNQVFFSIACAALLISPQALRARDRAPAAKDAAAKDETIPPAIVPPYVLKNRSKFDDPGASARVPFWPVGWTKQKQNSTVVPVAAEPKVTLDEKSFRVSSILISSGTTPSLAVINGRAYGEGEFLRSPKGSSARTRIRVERINDGTVTIDYDDQKIVVPLRRPELNQHKPEDELLDPNR